MVMKSAWREQRGKGGGTGGSKRETSFICFSYLPDFYSYFKASYLFY